MRRVGRRCERRRREVDGGRQPRCWVGGHCAGVCVSEPLLMVTVSRGILREQGREKGAEDGQVNPVEPALVADFKQGWRGECALLTFDGFSPSRRSTSPVLSLGAGRGARREIASKEGSKRSGFFSRFGASGGGRNES